MKQNYTVVAEGKGAERQASDMESESGEAERTERDPFMAAMGERVRLLRARRGMTRKALAGETGLSERHLANLESGMGNPSVQVLRQIAATLNCPLAEIIGDVTTSSSEWMLIRELLQGRDPSALQRARAALAQLFEQAPADPHRRERIALVGLRGAGKSTLGKLAAERLGWTFVELNAEIERENALSVQEIFAIYGQEGYRRLEQAALRRLTE